MFREGLAGGTATFERCNGGLRNGGIRLCPILPKVRLQILELHLELFDQPGMAFGAVAELLTAEFGDLELQVPDHRIGGGNDGARLYQFFLCCGSARLCREPRAARRTSISEGVSDMPKAYHRDAKQSNKTEDFGAVSPPRQAAASSADCASRSPREDSRAAPPRQELQRRPGSPAR